MHPAILRPIYSTHHLQNFLENFSNVIFPNPTKGELNLHFVSEEIQM